ncbi:hypothetical protein GCM10023185_16830 [Hymenobacter saemangeumensis]|uniref:Lipocalin-like domain-containing protein n=1 Tax=Hymenobacter saemangeumensis TaxID=1084522 RepID=A0ABP8IAH8_9BACT
MTTRLRCFTLALLTGSTFALTDCSKSGEPEPRAPSQREIWLTTPGWRLVGYAFEETTAAGVTTTHPVPLTAFDPCSLDDLIYYHPNKDYTVDEGLDKCSVTYPSYLMRGTWAFASDETELILNPGQPGAKPDRIRTLTATSLTLASPPDTLFPNGPTSVQIRTYAAQ